MPAILHSRHFPIVARLSLVGAIAGYLLCVLGVAAALTDIDDPVVRYAVSFLGVQAGVLAVTTCGLIVAKLVSIRREAARKRRVERVEDLLAEHATGVERTSELLQLAQEHPSEFLTAAEKSLDLLRGSVRECIKALLRQSRPYQLLLQEVTDLSAARAMAVISLVGKMDDPEGAGVIDRALEHTVPAVRLSASQAVLNGSNESAQWRVLESIAERSPWERLRLFHRIPHDCGILSAFVSKTLESGSDAMVLAALELVLSRQTLFAVQRIAHLAASKQVEIRIKSFKALRFLASDAEVVALLKAGLDDADWRVRAMAAQACIHFRSPDVANELLSIVRSSEHLPEVNYAVRALSAAGGEPFERLQREDLAGNELARRVMAEVLEREVFSRSSALR